MTTDNDTAAINGATALIETLAECGVKLLREAMVAPTQMKLGDASAKPKWPPVTGGALKRCCHGRGRIPAREAR